MLDMRWWIAKEALSAELAIIISYPTSASGITVLLKTPTKHRDETPIFSLFLILSRRVRLPCLESMVYNSSNTMMAKPIRAPELQYPMIQFFNNNLYSPFVLHTEDQETSHFERDKCLGCRWLRARSIHDLF